MGCWRGRTVENSSNAPSVMRISGTALDTGFIDQGQHCDDLNTMAGYLAHAAEWTLRRRYTTLNVAANPSKKSAFFRFE